MGRPLPYIRLYAVLILMFFMHFEIGIYLTIRIEKRKSTYLYYY